MKKILNFGSLNIDYVYAVAHTVRGGETEASRGLEVFPGGKGLNQSIAAARAGLSVFHAGLVGEDGGLLLDTLRADSVNTRFVGTVPGRSGHTIIQVDERAQNAILLFGGANHAVTPAYADKVLAHFSAGDVLLLQNEISAGPHILRRAAEMGLEIWFNPSPMDSGALACDLSLVSVFLLNEIEGEQLAGTAEPEAILSRMAEKYPQAAVVLTLGAAARGIRRGRRACSARPRRPRRPTRRRPATPSPATSCAACSTAARRRRRCALPRKPRPSPFPAPVPRPPSRVFPRWSAACELLFKSAWFKPRLNQAVLFPPVFNPCFSRKEAPARRGLW